MTFEDIKEKEWLIYEYRRGTFLYGLNNEDSDEDFGGVFMQPNPYLYGLRSKYIDQVADEKNDRVWYELNKFMLLLSRSNPTSLEALFASDKNIIFQHPIMSFIKEHKNDFITKQCFETFGKYAISQISKARFLKKKIAQPMIEKKDILDFCYVPYEQGSIPIKNWLTMYSLKQEYIGLVNIPNMHNMCYIYYDWKRYFNDENISFDEIIQSFNDKSKKYYNIATILFSYLNITDETKLREWFEQYQIQNYKGIIRYKENNIVSTEIIYSSVLKDEKPFQIMSFNLFDFQQYCREYREYKTWEKERNPKRYESNLIENYDSKNMMHCMRLMQMCIEIAKGQGFLLDRTNIDKDFLMDIRNHKFEYSELMKILNEKKYEMEKAIKESKIKESVNLEDVEKLLLKIRQKKIDHCY